MKNNLQNWIEDFKYEKEQIHKNLLLIPITASKANDFDFLTLDRAFDENLVHVKELGDASVPEIKVINKSTKFLIIFDGEHLIGAKQNRIVNHTIVINPLSEIVIPVSCTEQGRWHHLSKEFTKSDYNAPCSMRKASKMKGGSQSAVWDNVSSVMHTMNINSATSSLNEVYEEIAPKLNDYRQNVKVMPSQVGLIAFINGRFSGLDIIYDPKVFSDLYASLINGYILDSLNESDQYCMELNPDHLKSQLLDEVIKSKLTKRKNICAETRYVFKSDNYVGEFISFKGKPIHLSLFLNSDIDGFRFN